MCCQQGNQCASRRSAISVPQRCWWGYGRNSRQAQVGAKSTKPNLAAQFSLCPDNVIGRVKYTSGRDQIARRGLVAGIGPVNPPLLLTLVADARRQAGRGVSHGLGKLQRVSQIRLFQVTVAIRHIQVRYSAPRGFSNDANRFSRSSIRRLMRYSGGGNKRGNYDYRHGCV
jgi:hypothetical protein